MSKKSKRVFLICPVRNATPEQVQRMNDYISKLETSGTKVHYPARDTMQDDVTGYWICNDNTQAIREADEVHIFWDPQSTGSLFDLGAAFALKKPLTIVNVEDLVRTEGKSFTNMILRWALASTEDDEKVQKLEKTLWPGTDS